MISLKNFNLMKFIPQSFRESEDVQILCEIFDWYLQGEIYNKREKLFLMNLDEQTDDTILNELAYQEHVDYYDSSLSKSQKAELIKNSFKTHLTKGTRYAVESALNTVFNDFTLTEWFEYGGEPYHFKVITDLTNKAPEELLTDEENKKIIKFIEEYKNVRSICEGFIKIVEYIVPFETIERFSTLADMLFEATYSFYKLKLDGTWNLDGSQDVDGEFYDDFLVDVIKYGYRQFETKFCQNSYLLTDDTWLFDGSQNLDGLNNNYPHKLNSLKVVRYWSDPDLRFDGTWTFDGDQKLNSLDIRYPSRII